MTIPERPESQSPYDAPPPGQPHGHPAPTPGYGQPTTGAPYDPTASQPSRSTGRTVAAIVLLVLGTLATLVAVLATVGFLAVVGDVVEPYRFAGGMIAWWVLAVILMVPGLLLLRRPRRR